ncbi:MULTISPECIES: hypothetical protein [unclassified Microcoleus]
MKPPGFQPPGFQVHHKFDRTFVSNAIAHKTKNRRLKPKNPG